MYSVFVFHCALIITLLLASDVYGDCHSDLFDALTMLLFLRCISPPPPYTLSPRVPVHDLPLLSFPGFAVLQPYSTLPPLHPTTE